MYEQFVTIRLNQARKGFLISSPHRFETRELRRVITLRLHGLGQMGVGG